VTNKPMRPTCESCPFWQRVTLGGTGECRKHATPFPARDEDDWCGEHPMIKENAYEYASEECMAAVHKLLRSRVVDEEPHAAEEAGQ